MQVLENNKNKIITDYNNGSNTEELSKEYNVSRWSIKNILLKNNIKIRSNVDMRIIYNENFFIKESDELYYFWGFVLGDGSLVSNGKRKWITISLNIKDVEILQRFCKWLNLSENNIKYYRNNTVCRLNIYSKYFYKDLSQFGIVHRKTYNPVIPQIPNEYIKPFLLGLIDADGHISFNRGKPQEIDVVGHPIIMDWYEKQIRNIGYTGHIGYFYPKNIWKRIRVRRKADVINLIKVLDIKNYYHILLKRKWSNIQNYLLGKIVPIDLRLVLTDSQLIEIKNYLRQKTLTQKDISIIYSVSAATINRINKKL